MKALLIKYKLVLKFVLTFLLVYVLLSVIYKFYLEFFEDSKFYPDYVTHLVALQSKWILTGVGYTAEVLPHPDEPSMKLILNNQYLGRVIEGCNAISVIILFISFIIAFSGEIKKTIFYLLFGSVLIYAVNLLRITSLTLGIYHYPQYADVFHEVIFPGVIYGMVFLLWFFWVNRFSKQTKSNG